MEAGACHITYCQRATFSKWSRTELFLFHGENPRHRSPLFNRSIIARIGRDKPVMLMLPYAVWMYLSFATDSPWRSSIMLYFYCLYIFHMLTNYFSHFASISYRLILFTIGFTWGRFGFGPGFLDDWVSTLWPASFSELSSGLRTTSDSCSGGIFAEGGQAATQ